MAKKPTVTTISSGYASNTQLNSNFEALRDGFDNTLSLDGSTPNAMNAALDLNNNDILNVDSIQINSLTDGTNTVDITDITTVAGLASEITIVANDLNGSDTIGTVATNISNVNAVGNNISNVVAAGSNTTNINIVATDLNGSDTIGTVASDISNVNAVGSNISNVNSVASNNTNINTVATNIADVNTAASNINQIVTAVNTYLDGQVYLGSQSSNPTQRPDGSALDTGDLYFNTSADELRVWTGTIWTSSTQSAGGTVLVDRLTGNGSTTAYSLSFTPSGDNFIQVYIDGVYQQKNSYTLSSNNLTFSEAPPLNSEIEVVGFQVIQTSIGTTDASLVNYSPAGVGSQDRTAESKLREFVSVKDFGAVGDGVTDDTAAIQAAISFIETDGGAIFFPKGVYAACDLLVNGSNISLLGENGSTILQNVADKNILTVTGSNIYIGGLKFDGNNLGNFGVGPNPVAMSNYNTGILVGLIDTITIENCEVTRVTNYGIGVRTPTGVVSKNINILNNHVHDTGVRATGVGSPGNGGNTIAVGDTASKPSPTIRYVNVRGNIVHGCHTTLISMGETEHFDVSHNIVYDTDSNGIQVGTGSRFGQIHHNKVSDLTGYASPDVENRGISVHTSGGTETDIHICDNIIKDAQLYGIDVRVPQMVVCNNTIIDVGSNYQGSAIENVAGIAIFAGGALVSGNRIVDSRYNGIRAFVNNSDLEMMTISDNYIWASEKSGIVFEAGFSATGRFLQPRVQNNIVYGAGSFSTNGTGIVLSYATEPVITDNLVKDSIQTGYYITNCSDVIFDGNKSFNASVQDFFGTVTATNIRFGFNNDLATINHSGTYGDFLPVADNVSNIGSSSKRIDKVFANNIVMVDGTTAPATISGHASIYVDTADGDLKIKFGDGTVKTIVTDT